MKTMFLQAKLKVLSANKKSLKKTLAFFLQNIYNILVAQNSVVKIIVWRSRVAGRARTIGNRVTATNRSRVRIPPSPPKQNRPFGAVFVLRLDRRRFEPGKEANTEQKRGQ